MILVIARQGVAIREGKRLLDEQRSHLASSISHELRTPLTSIVGFLDLLDGDGIADPDERRQMISLVSHQAADLSRIVADLVLVASDVDRPVELEIGALPVADLVHSAVEATSLDPSLVSVELDTRMVAFVDQARMRQAVSSLLNNAARYGGRNIAALAQAKGGDLVIEVHDDGPGVPRKYELRIWEKFERGPNRLNAAVPGAGVGLAIASAIVAAHGGSAGYRRSERLGGACFWIRLPGRVHIEPSPAAGPALERPTATQSV